MQNLRRKSASGTDIAHNGASNQTTGRDVHDNDAAHIRYMKSRWLLIRGGCAEKIIATLAGRLPTTPNWLYISFSPNSYMQSCRRKITKKSRGIVHLPRDLNLFKYIYSFYLGV